MPDFLFVLCVVAIAGALAYLGIDTIRWASRRHPRQQTTEPVSPARTTTRPGRLLLLLVRRAHRDPDPVHVGATEDWSPTTEIAQVNTQPTTAPAPDWDADRWDLDVHAALNDMEDRFHHDVEHFWNWIYDRLGVDAKTRLRLASSVEQTGAIPRAELDAMLMEGAQA